MPDNDYHFITTWHVPGTVAAIAEELGQN